MYVGDRPDGTDVHQCLFHELVYVPCGVPWSLVTLTFVLNMCAYKLWLCQ